MQRNEKGNIFKNQFVNNKKEKKVTDYKKKYNFLYQLVLVEGITGWPKRRLKLSVPGPSRYVPVECDKNIPIHESRRRLGQLRD